MELRALSLEDASRKVFDGLSVNTGKPRLTTELIAASLRRAAGLMCPTSPTALATAVVQSFALLFEDEDLQAKCRNTLEDLLALGDLMEYEQIVSETHGGAVQRRLIYAAPPYFVKLSESRILLLGVAPDTLDPIPADLKLTISGHVRLLSTQDHASVVKELLHAGLHEVSYDSWAKTPRHDTAENVKATFDQLLDQQEQCSDFEGLSVLNSSIASKWYKDRWSSSKGLSGRFIGRRPRKYGADLWCYVEICKGAPQRLIDLPQGRTLERGCDQAWRLQCALDAVQGAPQWYDIANVQNDRIKIDIHIPCPNWLQRRWDCIGVRTGKSTFSYLFNETDQESESQVLLDQLWMIPKTANPS